MRANHASREGRVSRSQPRLDRLVRYVEIHIRRVTKIGVLLTEPADQRESTPLDLHLWRVRIP